MSTWQYAPSEEKHISPETEELAAVNPLSLRFYHLELNVSLNSA